MISENIKNRKMCIRDRLTRESLGINMETTLLGGDASNYETKLRLALTSSDDLPDVFPVYSAQLAADMIESGMVKDITDAVSYTHL